MELHLFLLSHRYFPLQSFLDTEMTQVYVIEICSWTTGVR